MSREIYERQIDVIGQALTAGPNRLLRLLRNITDDGRKTATAVMAWYADELGVCERTIQRWLKVLENLPGMLVTVFRQKVAPELNLPNRISIKRLWSFNAWAWAKAVRDRLSRKCVKGDTDVTHTPESYTEATFANVVPSETGLRLPGALLARVPPAAVTPARVAWLRRNGLRTT